MTPGTQIVFPTHAKGNLFHPDVEFGFVTSEGQGGATHFCRYWRKGHPGELRTCANSECTPTELLEKYTSVSQSRVDELLNEIAVRSYQ